jgi:DNA-binding MarR family transcriptional regulator
VTGEGSILYDVYVLHRAVGELLADALADAPLTPTEYAVYSFIVERDPVTPSEVSHALSMPRQTVSDWMALLRERGHITLEPNVADRRSQLISLTASGRRAHRLTNHRFEEVYRRLLERLPRSEAGLRATLGELTEAIRATLGEGADRGGLAQGAARTASSPTSRPAK